MKILQLNTEKTYRGGEKQTLYTILGLLKNNVKVGLICRKEAPLSKKAKEIKKIYPKTFSFWEASNYLEEIFLLFKVSKNFDIIHAQTGRTHSLAVITKFFHNKKVIYTRRVHFVPKGYFVRWKYYKTDKVIAISNNIKETLNNAKLPCHEVIYSCVYPKNLNYERARELIKKLNLNKKKIIGTFSAFVPHKDPFTLLKVVEKLKKLRKDFVILHFGEGELKEEIEKKVKERNLEDVYKIMGFWEDVEDFFSIFDVFIITSSGEGLGSSILDAFYYEVPVVGTAAGGIKEILQSRGILCALGDVDCIVNGIQILLKDKKFKKSVIKEAKRFVKEECTLDVHTQKYLKVYTSLIQNE